MKKAFRDTYNRELAFLKERSAEFAADYPGLADRLGGLVEENMDPSIGGLLEGTAFLAARVQLKLDEEFRTFTHQMLDQVFPDALAPTPSAMLVRADPVFDNKDIVQGVHFDAGEYLDARFVDADKRVSCRFALAAPITLWPLAIDGVKYHASPSTLGALGQDVANGTKAGLEITLTRVNTAGQPQDAGPLSDLPLGDLPLHFTGPEDEAIELYEQVHAGLVRASLRYLDKFGNPQFLTLAPQAVQQIGFDDQPLMGFRLVGLRQALRRIRTDRMQLILEFTHVNTKLATRLEGDHLQLFCAPAVNLFRENSSQVRSPDRRLCPLRGPPEQGTGVAALWAAS